MDFGNTPTTKTTERIMAEIREHLQPGTDHYNAVYSTIHRNLLATELVSNLARKQPETPPVRAQETP